MLAPTHTIGQIRAIPILRAEKARSGILICLWGAQLGWIRAYAIVKSKQKHELACRNFIKSTLITRQD